MSRHLIDSGVNWINEIPSHWNVIKVKRKFKYQKELVKDRVDEFDRLALTLNGVIKRSKTDNEGLQPEKFEGYQILRKNNLVFKLIDLENVSTSRVGLSPYDGIVSPAYIRLINDMETRFGYYFFISLWQREVFNNLGGSGVRSNLTANDLLNLPYLDVPFEEQQKIVKFLDEKVSQIDLIIEKTKQSIKELKKYKESLITETVTKGLNPNVEMRESGIEWIGEIPNHWSLTRLKYLISEPLQYGANSSGIPFQEDLPRYVRITDITEDNKLKDTGKLSLSLEEARQYILENNDLLFARSGATVGKTFLYMDKYGTCAFAGYLIRARIKKGISSRFIHYYTLSNSYNEWKKQIFIQSTIQNISAEKFANIPLALPSLNEQKQIVTYLDKKCEIVDRLIDKKEAVIKDMKSYKKSLIYEYVTGKKEVM